MSKLWECSRCTGRNRLVGRCDGAVIMVCTSCDHRTHFDSMSAVVQREEQLARESQLAREPRLAIVTN